MSEADLSINVEAIKSDAGLQEFLRLANQELETSLHRIQRSREESDHLLEQIEAITASLREVR